MPWKALFSVFAYWIPDNNLVSQDLTPLPSPTIKIIYMLDTGKRNFPLEKISATLVYSLSPTPIALYLQWYNSHLSFMKAVSRKEASASFKAFADTTSSWVWATCHDSANLLPALPVCLRKKVLDRILFAAPPLGRASPGGQLTASLHLARVCWLSSMRPQLTGSGTGMLFNRDCKSTCWMKLAFSKKCDIISHQRRYIQI